MKLDGVTLKINKVMMLYSVFICIASAEMLFLGHFEYFIRNVILISMYFLASDGFIALLLMSLALLVFCWVLPIYSAYNTWLSLAFWAVLFFPGKISRLDENRLNTIAKTAELILLFSIIISFLQGYVISKYFWLQIAPDYSIQYGRGAGFRAEPSYMLGPMFLYLAAILRCRDEYSQKITQNYRALIYFILLVLVTKSLSVVLLAPFVLMAFSNKRINIGKYITNGLVASIAIAVFSKRISEAVSQGSVQHSLTIGLGSWRNLSDFVIFSNPFKFMLPITNQRGVLEQISSRLGLGNWLHFTFSQFSTSVLSFGLVVLVCLVISFIFKNMSCWRRQNRIMAAIYGLFLILFFIPKFDVLSWFSFILLFSCFTECRGRRRRIEATFMTLKAYSESQALIR